VCAIWWEKILESIYSTFFVFLMRIFVNCICLVCIAVILCVFVYLICICLSYLYLFYLICICCTLCVFVVICVYLMIIKIPTRCSFFCSLFDGKTLHVSSVTRSSSGVQELCCSQVWYSIILDSVLRAVSVQGFVGPGLVCDGCPLGSVRCELRRCSLFTLC